MDQRLGVAYCLPPQFRRRCLSKGLVGPWLLHSSTRVSIVYLVRESGRFQPLHEFSDTPPPSRAPLVEPLLQDNGGRGY